ncbi:MAG: class III aminotransferase [SAR86 cluster bacterium]|uniref:Class III aminotransferase n=1 Tax=SAR86 cluster bacterium TaxID=2030880 RepID=A0A2A4XCD9_9GAMM|nr:MAG: class III aminotransferase [SAR86 cluster bacterium]
MIAVAPNGARKTQQDHPQLPINPKEIAHAAAACVDAGACMLHLHVRDENLRHSLDAQHYKEAIQTIRLEVGEDLIIQITTEAVGIYNREQQIQTVHEVRPEAVSLAIREISPVGVDEKISAEFFSFLQRERIAPQYILYDKEDILHFNELLERGIVPDEHVSVLLVLGRYAENQQSDSADLAPLLSFLPDVQHWSLCAFGASEADCMLEAIQRGGHCRVGFENNLLMANGSKAENNAALVKAVSDGATSLDRKIASADAARKLLGMS